MKRIALLVLLLTCALSAQDTRGVICGRVTDPSSSAIAAAVVTVINVDTNTSARLETNETGYYEATLLLAGSYQVSVEAAGFRKSIRSGITLAIGTRAEIHFQLDLGAVTDSVSVTAEAPILDANPVSSGRVIDNRSLMDLPVASNNAILLSRLAVGMQTSGLIRNLGGALNNYGSDYSTSGGVGGNEWSIDGVPNNGRSRTAAYLPLTDTIQEFKVETANFDASVGHTTGAAITMMSKTGTNQFHGALTEQHNQNRWNAASFFVGKVYDQQIAAAEAAGDQALAAKLRSQPKLPTGRSNTYAATVGGPVIVPKLFNGKNKLFFFFSFNGSKLKQPANTEDINRTVPTLANRKGDFSQLLAVDSVRYQIYDPLSVRVDPARAGHFIRDPFAGNILPASRLVNPAYDAYTKIYPTPNNDPTNPKAEPRYNYIAVASQDSGDYKAIGNRIDYHRSDRHRFFGRWSWNDYIERRFDWTYETLPLLNDQGLYRKNRGGTVDWVWTRSASTVIDVAVAANEYQEGNKIPVALSFKPSGVGLPAYLDEKAGDQTMLPMMAMSGYDSMPRTGSYPAFIQYRLMTGKVDVSHVRGNHSFRGGFDYRQHHRTGGGGGNTSGNFAFTNAFTRRNDDTFTPAGDFGLSWAAFMMGLPSSLTIGYNDTFAMYNPYYAWHLQDNWRLTPKLTVNIGLRVEYENGPTERFNRAMSYFDPAAKLPISDGAQQAYARATVPELAASQFIVQGGSLYAGVGGVPRNLWRGELMWLPKIAASYQVNAKTVLRAGYGMYFDTLNVLNVGADQTGFSRTTSTNVTNDFGVTWLAGAPGRGVSPLTDPFPVRADGTRFDAPVRDALGLMARVGRGWSFVDYDMKHARQQRWRVGVQRQLTANTMFEAAYAGAYSDRVYVDTPLSPLPDQYWASGTVRNDAIANNMNANVANPFRITNFSGLQTASPLIYQDMSTQAIFTGSTVPKNRLLRAYSQMNGLTRSASPIGWARTDSLELQFQRRFSKGFNLNVSYTRMRGRSSDFFLNEFDAGPSERQNPNTRPHRLTGTGVWELPFGRGRAFATHGIPNILFGGFQISATYEWQPGPLLSWSNLFYYGNVEDIGKGERTFDRWFNTDGFERNASKGPAAYHRRVFAPYLDAMRADATNVWSTNAQREFRIRESVAFELRMTTINLTNRTQFASPDTNPFSTNFGKVTTQTAGNKRTILVQGRLRF